MKNRRLTLEERKTIEGMLFSKYKHKDICKKLNIWASTLYREFKKCKGPYNAEEAHQNTSRGYKSIDFDIIGKRFGFLVVTDYVHKHNHRTYWRCKCDCGNSTIICRKMLAEYCSNRRPLSCGCIAKQKKSRNVPVSFEESSLRKYQDLIAFKKVNGKCWDYTGYNRKGIPMTSWKSKVMSVRKCMYLLVHGEKHESRQVYASCRNRLCFNPEHITLERPKGRPIYE